jgi:hypothetical protein
MTIGQQYVTFTEIEKIDRIIDVDRRDRRCGC